MKLIAMEEDSGTTFQRKSRSQQLLLKIDIFMEEVKEHNAFRQQKAFPYFTILYF